jgi:hypothetical protein
MNLNAAQMATTGTGNADIDHARAVRQAFTSFVGETFYSQMIKSMRTTTDKPEYFHGGKGEEVFTAQLDRVMSEEMTEASADRFANPMFERQFPKLGNLLKEYETADRQASFDAHG